MTFVHTGTKSGANVLVSAPVGGDDMDRRARMAATPARRVRFLLSGVLALAVLTGGSLYLARGELFAGPASSRATVNPRATAAGCDAAAASACPGDPAYLAVAAPPAVVTVPPRRARTSPSASAILPLAVAAPDRTRPPRPARLGQPVRACGRHRRRAGARADQPGPLRGRAARADDHRGPGNQLIRSTTC